MTYPCGLPRKTLYRPTEVAAILDISLDTVYRRIQDGSLEAVKIGRQYRIRLASLCVMLGCEKTC